MFKEAQVAPPLAEGVSPRSNRASARRMSHENQEFMSRMDRKKIDPMASFGTKNDGGSSQPLYHTTLNHQAPPRPSGHVSGKDRMKSILNVLMMRPKQQHSATDGASHGEDEWEGGNIADPTPDHSLKIFKADQHFRFLLVHQNTSAREVVMLALQEFGITECSSNYTLVEVTVDGGYVGQKRLPDTQTNLAERIGLSSRYYIKNIMSSDQLIPEDVSADLARESTVNLLQLNALEVAIQLMVEDFTVFRQIETTEYIDKLFELESKFGTPNLTEFGDLVNKEMMWVITEVVSESNISRRVKIIKQFIKIAQCCYKQTQNFNSMFAITSGLDHVVVRRLKSTWDRVPAKYSRSLADLLTVMDPSMNFRRYRNLIQNSRAPLIPIYPMVNKDLTFTHLGNESKVEGLVNFEKLRMLAKEIRLLSNMCSAPLDLFSMLEQSGSEFSDPMRTLNPSHYNQKKQQNHPHFVTMKRGASGPASAAAAAAAGLKRPKDGLNARKMYEEAQMVRRVKAYINKMPVIFDENQLQALSNKCEPQTSTSMISLPNVTSKKASLTSQPSSSSIKAAGTGKRPPSPSPSNHSTNSSASMVSANSANHQQKFGKLS